MPDLLKVACPHCGGSLKLKDRSKVGKKVRCPKCEEVFKVELPDEADDLDDFEDLDNFDDAEDRTEDEEDEAASRKKKSSSKKASKKKKSKSRGSLLPLLIVAISLLGVGLISGVVYLALNMGGSANKFNMAYLLPEHDLVIRVKVADVYNAPVLSSLVNAPPFQQQLKVGVPGELTVNDIDSVTMGMSLTALKARPRMNALQGGEGVVIVIRTTKPFDLSSQAAKQQMKESTHNGSKYYAGDVPTKPCQYAPDANTVVIASESELKRIIEQGKADRRRKEFDFVDPEHQVLVAAVPQAPDAFQIQAPATPPTNAPGAATMVQFQKSFSESAQGFSFAVDLKEGIDFFCKLQCKDDGGAGALKGQVDLLLAEAKSQSEKMSQNAGMLSPMVQQFAQLGQQTLNSVAVSQSTNMLDMKMSVPGTLKSMVDNAMKDPLINLGLMGMMSGLSGPPSFGNSSNGGPASTNSIPLGQLPPGFPMPDANGNLPAGTQPVDLNAIPMPKP